MTRGLYDGKEVEIIEQPFEFFHHTGNIFIKRMWLQKAGNQTMSHSHEYDHVTLLANGIAAVTVDDITIIYVAPCAIQVVANKHHFIQAVVDNTLLYCVHDTHGLDLDDLGEAYIPLEDKEK